MLVREATAQQYRAAAFALILIAAFTAGIIAVTWAAAVGGPLLLPLVVAYFLFNFGFCLAVAKGRLRTKGAKMGGAAVALNFAAMLLSGLLPIWTALSVLSVAVALIGATMLFSDARTAAT